MALDWSKEITFSGLKKLKASGSETELPGKPYINLAETESYHPDARKAMAGIAVAIVVLALVSGA